MPEDGGIQRGRASEAESSVRLRITYRKRGDLRFLSHLDFVRTLERALRRSELPIRYSQGFNPRIRLSFPGALPVGLEVEGEEFDVMLNSPVELMEVAQKLREVLPAGLDLVSVVHAPGRFRVPTAQRYELRRGDGSSWTAANAEAAKTCVASLGGSIHWLASDLEAIRLRVASASGGGTAWLREAVGRIERADPSCAPIRVRRLPSDPNETDFEILDGQQLRNEQSGWESREHRSAGDPFDPPAQLHQRTAERGSPPGQLRERSA